ncbi:MAG: type I restriction-modification system subunit M N-terminal domain-containing protein [Eubacterium sp.]|nr:type I restriction-modification system subunit M N-terminal domain-containing protein [Eubacterium sp.]
MKMSLNPNCFLGHSVLKRQLLAEGYGDEEDRDEYLAENIFYVPKDARWSEIKNHATSTDIGNVIDHAMDAIEKENDSLKGVLNKNYSRQELDKTRLGLGLNRRSAHGISYAKGYARVCMSWNICKCIFGRSIASSRSKYPQDFRAISWYSSSFSRMRSSTPFTRISISRYSTESLSMAESLLSSVVHINFESMGYQLKFHVEGAVFSISSAL